MAKRASNPKPAAAIIIGAKHQLKRGIKAAEKLANKIGHSVAVVLAPGGVRRSKRNTEGFKDALGNFHPIRSGDDYDPEDVGERRTYAPAKKKKAKRVTRRNLRTWKTVTASMVGKKFPGDRWNGFGKVKRIDVGKKFYAEDGQVYMENDAQRDARLRRLSK